MRRTLTLLYVAKNSSCGDLRRAEEAEEPRSAAGGRVVTYDSSAAIYGGGERLYFGRVVSGGLTVCDYGSTPSEVQ